MDLGQREKGSIAIDFVKEALVCIQAKGLDPHRFLIKAGIPPEYLDLPLSRVSSTQYGALWHGIAEALDDEFFGMDSRRMKTGSFTLLCHAIIHADTLERALRRALRFFRLIFDDLVGELQREGASARLTLIDAGPRDAANGGVIPPKRAFAYGTMLLMLHGLACWLIGRRIPLSQACFRCPEPPFSDEWRIMFTRTLLFNQPQSGFVFPGEYLDAAPVQTEARMKIFLRQAPANFLVKYKNSDTLSARIRRMLRDIPPADWPTFAVIAGRMHSSEPTLRRHLEEEGQSYRIIMDDLRHDFAVALLGETERSIADIALELGFAEPSAFHRAFKKWTGTSPGAYRTAVRR